ncbi:MAG: hypothetical protein EBZ47_01125 [Chlamydiae bacterium]|nr:hypothetical protein [Chlamydiota bacterium]
MFTNVKGLLLILLLSSTTELAAEDKSNPVLIVHEVEDREGIWKAKLRSRALMKLDKMLDWAFPVKDRSYHLDKKQKGFQYVNQTIEMLEFNKAYSFFSKKRPVISIVSSNPEDIQITSELFNKMIHHSKNEEFLENATAEILCKVLAYRDLKKGDIISIPAVLSPGNRAMVAYEVDEIFFLGAGMPAFGLASKDARASSILLFRGTDLSLESKQSWASVLSDLDIQGPGLSAFLKSRDHIRSWLSSQEKDHGIKPRVMGFSLGGVLSCYTMIHESDLISDHGNFAFNPPGVSAAMYKLWENLQENKKQAFKVFATHGDLVPKIGRMIGEAYELSLDFSLRPIDAHVRLIFCQANVYQFIIDIDKENQARR